MAKDYWIPGSVSAHKKGALHRMLGIPPSMTIPFTWLEEIRKTEIGRRVQNPTKIGFRSVKVTRLLKKRAVWALNLKRIGQGR
jgi:hypothetical protein